MGNTLEGAVAHLKDPFLVRRIQEYFGVTQITVEGDSSDATGEQSPTKYINDEGVNPANSSPYSSSGGDPHTKKGHRRLSSRDSNSDPNGTAVGASTYSIEWLKSNIKVRKRLRSSPSPVPSRTASPEPENKQNTTPTPVEVIVESYPLLDIYFRLAAELGYEPFYITFLPAMLWNVDSLVARHVVIIWCLSMYIGQACKQLFKLRRPDSPPALRLEQNPDLETEYGFPSTHAIVSTTIPFYYLYSCFGRYEVHRHNIMLRTIATEFMKALYRVQKRHSGHNNYWGYPQLCVKSGLCFCNAYPYRCIANIYPALWV